MATQDELAALFNRNLSFQPQQAYIPQQTEPTPVAEEEPYTYSISQHYNHSAHIRTAPPRPASEPPQSELVTVELVLAQNGVDPSALYPSQIDLFKTADHAQQLRLVELWRICPPEYDTVVAQTMSHNTSLQQEESMAKLRYERQMMEERLSRTAGDQAMDSDTMSDASTNQPLTPVQGGDGRWGSVQAEPYMASGYEALAAREYEQSATSSGPSKDIYSHFGSAVGGPKYTPATDPVYSNVGGDWQQLVRERQMINEQAMANQYGSYEQSFGAGGHHGQDEEML